MFLLFVCFVVWATSGIRLNEDQAVIFTIGLGVWHCVKAFNGKIVTIARCDIFSVVDRLRWVKGSRFHYLISLNEPSGCC